ncbi:TatD family hydrolase [Geopsychrobacter electrodiphilus]|uniref:TatD family hydrolase n=1 Tax=Geopsychrobacter electrodiphilus TaxID=225196 RepID=UPI00035EF7CD|nr:TatD family hydrolase [Geopsychrobacter electrodiphilus]
MTFCDTHIHLFAPEWTSLLASRLAAAHQAGIELLLQPGVRATGWAELIDLAGQNPGVYAAPGLHPLSADAWDERVAVRLRELCALPQVVAVGEIGLDVLLDVELAVQERAFRGQLEIAIDARLPVLIHCRKQTAAVLQILQEVDIARVGGIWHGFSGSPETARQIVPLGLKLGIGPVLLRETARKLPAVVKLMPADALVLETDAPDMAPGPEALLTVATKLAALRGWTLAETARITTENARQLLNI